MKLKLFLVIIIIMVALLNTTGPGQATDDPQPDPFPNGVITPIPPYTGFIDISLDPSSASPGTQVYVKKVRGLVSFDEKAHWRLSIEGNVLDILVYMSPTLLKFTIPGNYGCGTYQVQVFNGLTVEKSSVVTTKEPLTVSTPCTVPPKITSLSSIRGVSGQEIRIYGTGYIPGTVVKVLKTDPAPARLIEIPATFISSSQLRFRLPSIDIADEQCGNSTITVVIPTIRQGSNAALFYFACPKNTLNVVTYNVWMRPPQIVPIVGCVLFCDHQDERAPMIGERQDLTYRDVIILEEAFSDSHRNIIIDRLHDRYPFHTKVLGSDRGLEQDGGVIILSKWPIVYKEGQPIEKLFGGTCELEECFGDKGVLYARILKEGRPYHIFGTHLDSGWNTSSREIRENQLTIIRQFIHELDIPSNEGVIIGGDFNIDPRIVPEEYDNMFFTLDATLGVHEGVRDGGDNYITYIKGDLVDYVLYLNRYNRPTSAKNVILPNNDLSDHYPVVGKFVFFDQEEAEFNMFLPLLTR